MSYAHALTDDGALTLVADVAADSRAMAVSRWRPASARPIDRDAAAAADARIVVAAVPLARRAGSERGERILTFGGVTADARSMDDVALTTSSGASWGELRLDERRARIVLGCERDAVHAAPLLTLAAALLLGRLGRTLVHAAAAVAPDGGAWLLVGDTHAGKTTTCATLLEAGWRYCSDDQVIVRRAGDGALHVEGWPRVFHLDSGFASGRPAGGARRDVDAMARWPDRRMTSARLAGTLFPTVVDGVTALGAIDAADRLALMVRQSPWLFADAATAPTSLALLREMALLPGYTLRLGEDSFARPERMTAVLRAAVA